MDREQVKADAFSTVKERGKRAGERERGKEIEREKETKDR